MIKTGINIAEMYIGKYMKKKIKILKNKTSVVLYPLIYTHTLVAPTYPKFNLIYKIDLQKQLKNKCIVAGNKTARIGGSPNI